MQVITPQSLFEKLQKGEVDLIDVRTPIEYQEVSIQGSRNLPLDNLDVAAFMDVRDQSPGESLYVVCRSGARGQRACERFMASGFQDVVNVDGGVIAWEAAKLPVVRGRKVMSLERQVRIAAGFFILLGAFLGHFVHEGFFGISAFVGAGLIFAGLTDSCAMGILISKMPWNQTPLGKVNH